MKIRCAVTSFLGYIGSKNPCITLYKRRQTHFQQAKHFTYHQ